MNIKNNNQRGFTLVEMLIATTLMVVVFISIFSVMIASQRTHNTENRRLDMNQAGRGIDQFLVEPCREAGAVLTLLDTTTFLGAVPQFNGILPLNNTAYPDGVMIAAGDPNAVTKLAVPFTPGDGAITALTVNDSDGNPAWKAGDFGMVVRSNGDVASNTASGFYVFRVINVTPPKNLTVATTAAYYSSLLQTTHYDDPIADSGTGGTYNADSPVMRLDNFALFLVRDETDGSRTLVMVNDFNGVNLATNLSETPVFIAEGKRMIGPVPILPNIQDLQISYILGDGAPAVDGTDALKDLQNKTVSAIRFEMLLRTQEATETSGTGISYRQPAMGDSDGSGKILTGRYHYHFLTREVGLRNYTIKF